MLKIVAKSKDDAEEFARKYKIADCAFEYVTEAADIAFGDGCPNHKFTYYPLNTLVFIEGWEEGYKDAETIKLCAAGFYSSCDPEKYKPDGMRK